MHTNRRETTLNDLRRDPADGAYHCPKCDSAFTRRSNLRRHYSIHIRDTECTCHMCKRTFATSEELQDHTLHCTEDIWDISDSDFSSQRGRSPDFSDGIAESSVMNRATPTYFGQTHVPNHLFSMGELLQAQHDEDFASLLSSMASSTTQNTPTPTPPSTPLSGISQYDFTLPEAPMSLSQHTPATSNGISSKKLKNTHEAIRGLRPRPEPYPAPNGIGRRKPREKSVYTRRQVEDMLDIVSNCFVGRMEEVLRRINTNGSAGDHAADTTLSSLLASGLSSTSNELLGLV